LQQALIGSGWALRAFGQRPWAWVGAAVAAASWPTILVVLPPQLTVTGWTTWQLIEEVVFLAGLASVAGMTALLVDHRWLLAQMAPGDRFRVELGGLATAAALGTLLPLVPALAFSPGVEPRFASGLHHGCCLMAMALHTVALASVTLRLPGRAPLLALGLFVIAWGIPALIPAHGGGAKLVRGALDATIHVGRDWQRPMTWTRSLVDMMPIAALLLWGRWLPSAPPPRS